MKKIAGFVLFLLMVGCHAPVDTKPAADKSFDDFFQRFKTDSVFQGSRIKFPLKVVTAGEGESDTRTVAKTQLKFIGLFVNNKHGIIKKKTIGPTKVLVQFQIQDTGFEEEFTFENISSVWYLVTIKDNSD